MKRILAFVLAASMLLGNTTTAFATTVEEPVEIVEEAIGDVESEPESEDVVDETNEQTSEEVNEEFISEENIENSMQESVMEEVIDFSELESEENEIQQEENLIECEDKVQQLQEQQPVQMIQEVTTASTFLGYVIENTLEISNVYIEQDFEYITLKWECDPKQEAEENLYGFRVYMSSELEGNYSQIDEEKSGEQYYSCLISDIELDVETGKNVTKYFKIVPVYYILDDEGYITNEYIEGEAYGPYSNEGAYYAENTQTASTILVPNPYIGLCFLGQDENGEYSKVDELELHVGESKKLIVGFIDTNGKITPVPSEKEYAKLLNSNSAFIPSAQWGIWEYGDDQANEESDYARREFTVEMSDGFAAYYTGTAITGEGNYFLQYRRNFGIGWYYERIPLTVLEAEEGVVYPTAPIIEIGRTTKEVNAILREKMKNRDYTYFGTTSNQEPDLIAALDFYMEREGMKPDEGDYLNYAQGHPTAYSSFYDHFEAGGSIRLNGETFYLYKIGVPFITTRAQEDEVDAKIKMLLSSDGALGGLDDKSDTEKVRAIYDYVKKVNGTVPGDRRTPIYHTAYHALMKGSGTCEAYALLFTRLTRELGIASKVIMGTDANAHTYNIVEIDGQWYYIDCSAGIWLSSAKTFKRTKEQEQYKDQRFINNYLCKVVDSKETYIAEPGVIITNDEDDTEVKFERGGEVIDVLAEANAYICADAAMEGNESKKYKITLTANLYVASQDGETLDFGEYADRVEIDLNNHSIIAEDYMSLELCAGKVSNGTIVLGVYSHATIGLPDENENSVYTDLLFKYKQSSYNIDFGEYASSSIWVEKNGSYASGKYGTVTIEEDVNFSGKLNVRFESAVHNKANIQALSLSLAEGVVSEGTLEALEECNIYGNVTVNDLKSEKVTYISPYVNSIIVYGDLLLAGSTTLGGTETIKINPVKTFSSADAEEADSIGTVSLKGKFISDYISLGTPFFSLIPMSKIVDTDEEEGVYTVGDNIATLTKVFVKTSEATGEVAIAQNNLEKFIICPLDSTVEGLELELDEEKLLATIPSVTVSVGEENLGKYSSLKNAIVAINGQPAPLEGQYIFTFERDTIVSKDLTLPTFVKEPIFRALEIVTDEGNKIPAIKLDLCGYKLNVTNGLTVESGLNIIDSVGGAVISASKSSLNLHYREGYEGNAVVEPKIETNKLLVNTEPEAAINRVWNLKDVVVTNTFRNEEYSVLKADVLTMNSGIFINESNAYAEIGQVNKAVNAELKNNSWFIVDKFIQTSSGTMSLWTGSNFVVHESAIIYKPTLLKTNLYDGDAVVGTIEEAHLYKLPETKIQIQGSVVNKAAAKLSFGLLNVKAMIDNLASGNPVLILKDFDAQTILFDTTISISKLPLGQFVVEQSVEDSESEYNVVFRTENTVYAGAEWFVVKRLDGDQETELEQFAKWSDTVAYINKLNNTKGNYIIEISESIDLNETLTMPSKLASLTVRGVDDIIKLTSIGDIKLAVPTVFENLQLFAKKYNSKTKTYQEYASVLNLNQKKLTLDNVTADFTSVSNGTKTDVTMIDADISVLKSTVSLKNLFADTSILTADTVSISSRLEIGNSRIDCKNKLTLKDIKSLDDKNVFNYGGNNAKKNILTINGSISSDLLKTTTVKNADGADVEIRENAIRLEMDAFETTGYTQGILLCNAPKVGAGWFVIGSEWNEESGNREQITFGTYKKGNSIYCGQTTENVKLYSSVNGEEGTYNWESSFGTLKEAFAEIDKLGISSQWYTVKLEKADKDIVSSTKTAITFPSKAKNVTVTTKNDEKLPIYFKGNLTLKTNTVFENILLIPAAKYSISLGKFTLTLDKCSNEGTLSGISGSGVTKTSVLELDETSLYVQGSVNNIGKIIFNNGSIVSTGTVNIGDVVLHTDANITGSASVTRKKGIITKLTSKITINGQVINATALREEEAPYLYLDFTSLNLTGEDAKNVVNGGFNVAKAPKVNYVNILHAQFTKLSEITNYQNVKLIKSKGYLVYFDGEPVAELSYLDSANEKITSFCKSFGDAVTDINNLKVKRDYQITMLKDIDASAAITMPSSKYVSLLTIDGKGYELGFIKNISFTSNTLLKDIHFVQKVKVGSVYKPANEVKAEYPAAVTVTTPYRLAVEGMITFNTPLVLNGSKKGTLALNEGGVILTNTNGEMWPEDMQNTNFSHIYGAVNNFLTVEVTDSDLMLEEYRVSTKSYKASLSATNLKNNSGDVRVKGKTNLKNVVMQGDTPVIESYQDFNITGNLMVEANDSKLMTHLKGIGKEPYLYVSGNVVRKDEITPITVNIGYPMGTQNSGDSLILTYGNKVSSQLLKVKNAQAYHFIPATGNLPDNINAPYGPVAPYDPLTNPQGYILVKSGTRIYLEEGSKANVMLYEGVYTNSENDKVRGAYPSLSAATTAVNTIKNKGVEYTYVMVNDQGSMSAPITVAIPSYAAKVTIQSLSGKEITLFTTNKITLKSSTELKNLTLAPVSKKKGTALSFDTANYNLALTDVKVYDDPKMSFKDIIGKGKQTIVLDSQDLELTGKIYKANTVIVNKDAAVNGAVTTNYLQYKNEDVQLNVKGKLSVKYPTS